MAQLTASERLAKVKTALKFDGTNYHDDTLQIYIDEVIEELIDAGVAKDVAESTRAVGCIILGVNDLMYQVPGGVKHSDQFNKRMTRLALKEADKDVST